VKIDKTFIDDMERVTGNLAIVAAIISLAHALDLTVVAEGVETEASASDPRGPRLRPCPGLSFSPHPSSRPPSTHSSAPAHRCGSDGAIRVRS
jgi:predicted signal transduction protein with EAL and GGDEF domain